VCRRRDAIRLRLGRPALHVGHHDQAVDEAPTVHGRDRHRHRHPFTVEVSQQLGLPRQIRAAALAEPSDGKLAVDAHAPHIVHATGLEPFDASDIVTPLIECLPSHGHSFAEARTSQAHSPRHLITSLGQRSGMTPEKSM
jgi:hypothetical protein